MASTFLSAPKGGSKNFDVPVAALAGLSVAFAVFAAPPDLLAELIRASGLPAILPAAEPPLGLNARIAVGAAGAIVMFAFAFLLLRWLDRFGRRRADRDEAETEAEMPRLRRRDFHPDAAPRPPLFAGSELGEPELELTQEPEPETEVEPAPEPELQLTPRLRRAWLPETPAETAEEPAQEPEIEPSPEPFPAPVAKEVPRAQYGSISELLDRLEQGLARRRPGAPAMPAPAPAEERAAPPPVAANAADDRLQSAIDSLQRLASRQD